MILSQRIQSLTASPIRKLSPYADAAKAAGKKVYHLNIGQPLRYNSWTVCVNSRHR